MQQAPGAFEVLGVRVDVVQIADVIHHMRQWIDAKGPCRWIAVTGMYGVMVAQHDAGFRVLMGPRFVVRSMAQVLRESVSKRGQ